MKNDTAVCGDAGRQFFYEYAGKFFELEPKGKALPIGTPCTRCGATNVELWENAKGTNVCRAQRTITAKRQARATETEPLTPTTESGKTSLGDGHMVLVGPYVSKMVTNLRPSSALPADLEIRMGGSRAVSLMRRDLISNPPDPPFIAIIFGQKADHDVRITTTTSTLYLNGPDAAVIERPYLLRLLKTLAGASEKTAYELLNLRARLARGFYDGPSLAARERAQLRDQTRLPELLAITGLSLAQFRQLPPPSSSIGRLLLSLKAAQSPATPSDRS